MDRVRLRGNAARREEGDKGREGIEAYPPVHPLIHGVGFSPSRPLPPAFLSPSTLLISRAQNFQLFPPTHFFSPLPLPALFSFPFSPSSRPLPPPPTPLPVSHLPYLLPCPHPHLCHLDLSSNEFYFFFKYFISTMIYMLSF